MQDTNSFQIDEILEKQLEKAFHKQTSIVSVHDIAKIAIEHSPIDLALAVSHLPPHARPVLYDNLPSRQSKIDFIVNTDNASRQIIFRYMNDHEMNKLIDKMALNEEVDILEDLSEGRCKRVMEMAGPKKATQIKELKKHHRNSAGRLMTSEFFAFQLNLTIGSAVKFIRDNPQVDFTRGIFLLNAQKELQGFVPERNLLINSHDLPLKQVMRPVVHKVYPDTSREEVVETVERYKLFSLPVVDKKNHLLGVITQEDVMEAMEDLADEAFARIAGTVENVSFSEPVIKKFLARSPWLIFTLFDGLINGWVMSSFERKGSGFLTFTLPL